MRRLHYVNSFTTWFPVVLLALLSCSSGNDVDRQAEMTTCELIRDFGYSCETLNATTDDRYVLEVDRVGAKCQGNGTTATAGCARGRPLLVVPGILAESGMWFVNFPLQTPGFLLADAGYDVWVMNTRDIAFRSSNLQLSQDDDEYWLWSFDEIGRYDIAAAIDLVRNATGADKLPMLVHSQGFVASLVLLSTRPDYNEKVDILIGYAPVSNLTHVGFPFPELMAISDLLFLLLDPTGDGGYFHLADAPKDVVELLCEILQGQPCSLLSIVTLLMSPEQLNDTRTPVILAHFPIGTSYQNLHHYVQVYRAENFVMYDYGNTENKKRYGQRKPPAYPLENIAVPVALYSSNGDTLADPDDVAGLIQRLGPRVLFNNVVPPADFSHADFLTGYQATDFLHRPMISTLASRANGRR